MKFRNGFVSNSSSSSFIIFLDKKPETEEDITNHTNIKHPRIIADILKFSSDKSEDPIMEFAKLLHDDHYHFGNIYNFEQDYPFLKRSAKEIAEEIMQGRFPVALTYDNNTYELEDYLTRLSDSINIVCINQH